MTSILLTGATAPATALQRLHADLGDPRLELVYRRSATGTWIDEFGFPYASAELATDRRLTPLERDGDWIAALIHDAAWLDRIEQIEAACAVVQPAIDAERLTAELRAQVRDEQASRARIVAASDRQRRRFERNLHDGAQQRLVGLALTLNLASRWATGDPQITELLAEAVAELEEAINDLHALARGLHPAIIKDAGLAAALHALAEHPGIPVQLALELPDRLPDVVEVAAYYLVAESLANANRHSGGKAVTVTATVQNGVFRITVTDDGRGGVESSGSGLIGLADRLGALGGNLTVVSEPGQGTTVTGQIPLQAPSTPQQLVDDILLRVVADESTPGRRRHEPVPSARAISGDQDRRLRSLIWMTWQNHAAPREFLEAQPDSEDLLYAKALLLFLGGNRTISADRRDWVIGYLTAAGYSEAVLAAAAAYDDSETIEELMALPRIAITKLVVLYDALRACAMTSYTFEAEEFDPVLRAADRVGVPRDVVADLHQIVIAEQRLREQRHNIVVAPALPKVLNDSIAAIKQAHSHRAMPTEAP